MLESCRLLLHFLTHSQIMCSFNTHRERETETDRQTNGDRDRQTETARQRDRATETETARQTERDIRGTEIEVQTDRQTELCSVHWVMKTSYLYLSVPCHGFETSV